MGGAVSGSREGKKIYRYEYNVEKNVAVGNNTREYKNIFIQRRLIRVRRERVRGWGGRVGIVLFTFTNFIFSFQLYKTHRFFSQSSDVYLR